ncbi:MAG TPA: hypothetical protein DIU15_05275 [Deltaproteobacteria bacterium]|nr:hypothetical protein [Deltaproteobacteria bacterium]HCP45429.1 hypothetical protein [Deltaproteobacteria bacterium]
MIIASLLAPGCLSDQLSISSECTQVLQKILDIQDERGTRVDAVNEVYRLYEAKEVSREGMLKQSEIWKAHEAALRAEVSLLYEAAREKGCL